MNINYQSVCGRLGRYTQLLQSAKEALKQAYEEHKKQIKRYDECLRYANGRMDIYRQWSLDCQAEKDHWKARAEKSEKENFDLRNER